MKSDLTQNSVPAFADSVRRGTTKAPQQIGFKLSSWEKYFTDLTSGAPEDKDIYEAGIWFSNEFDQVRALTEKGRLAFRWSSRRNKILAVVGYAIWQWSAIKRLAFDELNRNAGGAYFPSELAAISAQSPMGETINVSAFIEMLVDGLRYPLSIDFKDDPVSAGGLPELKAVMKLVLSGQHYHLLEQTWLDCVWNGYHVSSFAPSVTIEHKDASLSRKEAVSEFRRQCLIVELAAVTGNIWNHGLSDLEKWCDQVTSKTLSVFKRNGRYRVKAADALRFNRKRSTPPMFFLLGLIPEYVKPLLHKPVRIFRNLTLLQIIHAYALISEMPEQVAPLLPSRDDLIADPERFVQFAPVFLRGN